MSASTATTPSYRVQKTNKQAEAVRLIASNRVTLLEGGGRSGKTFIALYAILVRALRVPSRHLIARFRFAHAKQAICYDTMPAVLEAMGIREFVHLNKTDWFYELPNGSTIWVGGLDDKERTEKILGNEYATIFLNEASQISYAGYEMLVTRLNPPKGLHGRIIIDYNPPSIQHWGYQMFHKHRYPDGRTVPDTGYAKLKMNPADNPHLSPEYLENLQGLSEAKRKRFLEGEYSLDSGSLWRREWIRYDAHPPELERIAVGVDPAGTADGDEIGIVVVGKLGDHYYVLDDYSLHGTPSQWAAEVGRAYALHRADIVVAEKNYGGDMVESTIRQAQKNINTKLVNASRGKHVRAEPISALYEQDRVRHKQPMIELEDEMCIFTPESNDSPNRMDALVWALTELSQASQLFIGRA